jgi:hypothetical protein
MELVLCSKCTRRRSGRFWDFRSWRLDSLRSFLVSLWDALYVIGSSCEHTVVVELLDTTSLDEASAHEVSPINNLFQPPDFIRPFVSLTVVKVLIFRHVDSQVVAVSNVFHPADTV